MKKITFPNEFVFCVYPVFYWGDIVKKILLKVWVSEKKKNTKGVYRKGKSLLHTIMYCVAIVDKKY